MSRWAALPAVVVVILLSGCVLTEIEDAEAEIEQAARQVAAVLPPPPARPDLSTVRVIEHQPYVGLERVIEEGAPAWLREMVLTLPLEGIDEAPVLASRIEAASGYPVSFIGDVPAPDAEGEGEADEPATAADDDGGQVVDLLSPGGTVWTGPLSALLDAWTQTQGFTWRYAEALERLEVVRSQTVVFEVHALAGEQRYSVISSTQDQADEEDTSNLTQQQLSTEATYEPWAEIETQLKALAGATARIEVAPASATVMVRGRPRDVERVRAFLGYLNREVLRPVTLSVHVYSVTLEQAADYELGLTAFLAQVLGSFSLGVAPDSIALIKPEATPGESTLTATVRALNRAGSVSRVLSADIPSLNGKPAQFYELYKEAYLKEQRTTLDQGVAHTVLTPGTVSSGIAISYIPRITGPGEVLVRFFASLQDRPAFTEFSSGEQSIQLPAYGSRAIQVTQKIGRGETLLVTGFSDRGASASRSGTFDADIPFPGGGREGKLVRIERVLLLTAEIGAPLGLSEVHGVAL